MKKPIKFQTRHRAKFSQIDPYGLMHNQYYLDHFMDHRMTGLRENLGWDLQTLQRLPIQLIVKSVKIDFLRPIKGDVEFVIESQVNDMAGVNCEISCKMQSLDGKTLSECQMTVVALDSKTLRPCEWPDDIKGLFFEANIEASQI